MKGTSGDITKLARDRRQPIYYNMTQYPAEPQNGACKSNLSSRTISDVKEKNTKFHRNLPEGDNLWWWKPPLPSWYSHLRVFQKWLYRQNLTHNHGFRCAPPNYGRGSPQRGTMLVKKFILTHRPDWPTNTFKHEDGMLCTFPTLYGKSWSA